MSAANGSGEAAKRRVGAIGMLLALCLATGICGSAHAQPPSGIVRPTSEAGLTPLALGAELFAGNCLSCHGIAGSGVRQRSGAARGSGSLHGAGPPLRGVGAQAADFYLRTGFMPLGSPTEQPFRRRVLFNEREIEALIAYVASLGPGPGVPQPSYANANVAAGLQLFTEHCAGCHQAVAEGGLVTGAVAPPIKSDTATEIAEAVRVGPYVMPRFSTKAISDAQLSDIIAYVLASRHPANRGGWGIGDIGPIPEGIVAWLVALTVLIAVCVVIGTRVKG